MYSREMSNLLQENKDLFENDCNARESVRNVLQRVGMKPTQTRGWKGYSRLWDHGEYHEESFFFFLFLFLFLINLFIFSETER